MSSFVRLFAAVLTLLAGPALAHGGGVSGYSGLSGSTCTSCHSGGTAPAVALNGPTSLTAGQTATYTFTITGGPAVVGGLDVAATAGATLTASGTTQLKNGEVTHLNPNAFSGGSLSYSFSVKAGSSSFTLYAAGLSANGSGTNGDGTRATTLAVTVAAAANQAPAVALTSPSGGSSFTAPATIALAATASDADGTVAKVEFFAGTVKLGEDLTSPYTYSWSGVAAGSYALTARATDNAGATTTSQAVSVTVAPAPVPNVPPTVSLTSPAPATSYTTPATIGLAATAADADGTVTKVEFFAGTVKLGEDTAAPYTYSWNASTAGTYDLTARATDNAGAMTTSQAVRVTVASPPAANVPPSVTLTSPAAASTFTAPATVSVAATAADSDGTVAKVEFFAGAMKIGEDLAAPYSFSWANVAAGTYSLTAVATDNAGATTTSNAVTITVNGTPAPSTSPPTVQIVKPSRSLIFGDRVAISVRASDADGRVVKVEYFDGTVKFGESLTAPYTYTWTNAAPGQHTLKVVATDDSGLSSSASTSIAVVATVCRHDTSVPDAGCDLVSTGKKLEEGPLDGVEGDTLGCSTTGGSALSLALLAAAALRRSRSRR